MIQLRQSGGSQEGYRSENKTSKISEYDLMKKGSLTLRMCKKKNISYVFKQTLDLFNERVKHGDTMEESNCHYKKQVLDHGAYLLLNILTSNVYAAGILNNDFEFGTTQWSKIDTIVSCQYGKGYGSLLMKYMVDVAPGDKIFAYAVTDRKGNAFLYSN